MLDNAVSLLLENKEYELSDKLKKIIDQNGIVYDSIIDASRKTGANKTCISMVIHGKRKRANGMFFKFLEEAEK